MTRPKMVLVPETAVRDGAQVPVVTCGTCANVRGGAVGLDLWCGRAKTVMPTATLPPDWFCADWEPKE